MFQSPHSGTNKVSGGWSASSASRNPESASSTSRNAEYHHDSKMKNAFESQNSVTRSNSVSLNNTSGWSAASESKSYSGWNHGSKVKNFV